MSVITRTSALAAFSQSLQIAHTLGTLLNNPAASSAALYSAVAGAGIAAVGATAMYRGNMTQGVTCLAAGTTGMATGGAAVVELLSGPDHAQQAFQLNAALGEGLTQLATLQTEQQASVRKLKATGDQIGILSAAFRQSMERTTALLDKQKSSAATSTDRLADINSRYAHLASEQLRLLEEFKRANDTGSATLILLQMRLSQLQRGSTFTEADLAIFEKLPKELTLHFTKTDELLARLLKTSLDLQEIHLELNTFSEELQEKQRTVIEDALQELAGAEKKCVELEQKNQALQQGARELETQAQEMQATNTKLSEAQKRLTEHLTSLIKTVASLKRFLCTVLALSFLIISSIVLVPAIKIALVIPAVVALGAGVIYGKHHLAQLNKKEDPTLPAIVQPS